MSLVERQRVMAALATPAPAQPFQKVSGSSRKLDPLDYLVRSAVCAVYGHVHGMGVEKAREVIARHYPRYGDELTRDYCAYQERGAVAPAMTYVPNWAAELVGQSAIDEIGSFVGASAFTQLSRMGLHIPFGQAGRIAVPGFDPSIAGDFVREGNPIPVAQAESSGQWLTPKAMKALVTFTMEINEHSIPSIEALLRVRIRESTSIVLDRYLFDDQPGDDRRPPGLLFGGEEIPSVGGLQGDTQALAEGLSEATTQHMRMPVLVMNPAQMFAARLYGEKDIPIISSPAVPPGRVIALDAADFVSAGGDTPRFEISQEAVLHMEDTTPRQINDGAMAAPVRSLWQTATLSLRMVLKVDWCLRRPGAVAYMSDVFWTGGGGGSNPRARTFSTQNFIQPAPGASATVDVDQVGSLTVGQDVWIEPLGYFQIDNIQE